MGILPRIGFRCNPPPITFVIRKTGMGSRSTAYVGGHAAIETRPAKNQPAIENQPAKTQPCKNNGPDVSVRPSHEK
jgi:hypothetical protein